MSATVRIPTILRSYTGGANEVTADGAHRSPRCWTRWSPTTPASGPGCSTTPARCAASSTSTWVTTTSASSAAWRPTVADGAKISIIPAVAGG